MVLGGELPGAGAAGPADTGPWLFSGWACSCPPLNNVKGLNWGSPGPSHCRFSFGLTPRKAFPRAALFRASGPSRLGGPPVRRGRHSWWERAGDRAGDGCAAPDGQCSSCPALPLSPLSPPLQVLPSLSPQSLPDKPLLPSQVPLSFSDLHLHPCLAHLTSKGPSEPVPSPSSPLG